MSSSGAGATIPDPPKHPKLLFELERAGRVQKPPGRVQKPPGRGAAEESGIADAPGAGCTYRDEVGPREVADDAGRGADAHVADDGEQPPARKGTCQQGLSLPTPQGHTAGDGGCGRHSQARAGKDTETRDNTQGTAPAPPAAGLEENTTLQRALHTARAGKGHPATLTNPFVQPSTKITSWRSCLRRKPDFPLQQPKIRSPCPPFHSNLDLSSPDRKQSSWL